MLVEILKAVLSALRSIFRSRAALLAENVVLRQQIIVLHRSVPKPRLRARDRVVLALAARVFGSVLKAITIVRPETVIRWHRSFWRLLWRRKSGRPVGRPPADVDLRIMIRRLWTENPLWGEDRIAGELCKLGYKVSSRTVAKYRPPHLPRNRGQSWPTFIRNPFRPNTFPRVASFLRSASVNLTLLGPSFSRRIKFSAFRYSTCSWRTRPSHTASHAARNCSGNGRSRDLSTTPRRTLPHPRQVPQGSTQ